MFLIKNVSLMPSLELIQDLLFAGNITEANNKIEEINNKIKDNHRWYHLIFYFENHVNNEKKYKEFITDLHNKVKNNEIKMSPDLIKFINVYNDVYVSIRFSNQWYFLFKMFLFRSLSPFFNLFVFSKYATVSPTKYKFFLLPIAIIFTVTHYVPMIQAVIQAISLQILSQFFSKIISIDIKKYISDGETGYIFDYINIISLSGYYGLKLFDAKIKKKYRMSISLFLKISLLIFVIMKILESKIINLLKKVMIRLGIIDREYGKKSVINEYNTELEKNLTNQKSDEEIAEFKNRYLNEAKDWLDFFEISKEELFENQINHNNNQENS
jgi:hypothetical protein